MVMMLHHIGKTGFLFYMINQKLKDINICGTNPKKRPSNSSIAGGRGVALWYNVCLA
jgi:hypothetical protein